jgi:hypothetical protein
MIENVYSNDDSLYVWAKDFIANSHAIRTDN